MIKQRATLTGRLLAFIMSFLIVFSGMSSYGILTAEAAEKTASGEEELGGMLSVGTVVNKGWQADSGLQKLLNERDSRAAEYSGKNNISDVNNKSGGLGNYTASSGVSGEWVSNVLYRGDILRSDSFEGFTAL